MHTEGSDRVLMRSWPYFKSIVMLVSKAPGILVMITLILISVTVNRYPNTFYSICCLKNVGYSCTSQSAFISSKRSSELHLVKRIHHNIKSEPRASNVTLRS